MDNTTMKGCTVFIGCAVSGDVTVMLPKNVLLSQYALLLLKYAYEKHFGKSIDGQNLHKTQNGQWVCDNGHISISHSGNYVAVALCNTAVGVDLQMQTESLQHDLQDVANKFFNKDEIKLVEEDDNKVDAFYFIWAKKEALWKKLLPQPHTIKNADTTQVDFYTQKLTLDDQAYYLAVTEPNAKIVLIKTDIVDYM